MALNPIKELGKLDSLVFVFYENISLIPVGPFV